MSNGKNCPIPDQTTGTSGMVKTADDRLAVVWPEFVRDEDCSDDQLGTVIVNSLKRHGRSFESVFQNLIQKPQAESKMKSFSLIDFHLDTICTPFESIEEHNFLKLSCSITYSSTCSLIPNKYILKPAGIEPLA